MLFREQPDQANQFRYFGVRPVLDYINVVNYDCGRLVGSIESMTPANKT